METSSLHSFAYSRWTLDDNFAQQHGWCPWKARPGEWIQVTSENPRFWTSVIIQGRGDYDQWVKSFQVSYSMNGKTWKKVENGRTFTANNNRNQKVRVDFSEALYARVVRIHPISWQSFPCMRFDVTFVDFCLSKLISKEVVISPP